MPPLEQPQPTSPGPSVQPATRWQGGLWPSGPAARISVVLATASFLAMLGVGSVRLLRDGSLWLDEAAIAYNLLHQGPLELFGPYITGHSFPRLYLALINGLQSLLGYHTMVLRLLPYAAFVAGALFWNRLTYRRLRGRPVLLALIITLNLIPGTWYAYAAMLKQYSLDVMLALIPFLLSDAFFDKHLRRGQQSWRLLPLALLALTSFTYLIPLLGRTIGWYLAGLRREGHRIDPRGAASFIGSVGLSAGGLWLIDMRHTALNSKLLHFWGKCIAGSRPERNLNLLDRFVGDWYRGTMPFSFEHGLPPQVVALLLVLLSLGGIEVVRRALARGPDTLDTSEEVTTWGSRSAGCLVCIGGVIAASFVVKYPICPGRLTLFALFSLQMLTLEGLYGVGRLLRGRRATRVAFEAAALLLVALCIPTAYRSARYMVIHDVPENIRPLLHFLDEEPEIPVVVAACSTQQMETMPEFRERDDIFYYDKRAKLGLRGLPDYKEIFVISAGTNFYCPWFIRRLHKAAEHVRMYQTRKNTASLLKVRMRERPKPGG